MIGDTVEQRARELIVFANGVEEAGMVEYARRARIVAWDALILAGQLKAERSARRSVQAARDRLEALLMARSREEADRAA